MIKIQEIKDDHKKKMEEMDKNKTKLSEEDKRKLEVLTSCE